MGSERFEVPNEGPEYPLPGENLDGAGALYPRPRQDRSPRDDLGINFARVMATKKIRSQGGERQSALDAATQLMAEREKYESWLDDLEAKKDSTPAKVFDRVRQDYVARLQTVMEQLGQYTATLQEHAENLVTKLRELE